MSKFLKDKKTWWIAAAIVVVSALLAQTFSSANASDAALQNAAAVVSLELAQTVDASGTLNAQPFASLNWKTGGVVESVFVKVGDKVKAGEILLTLQPESTSASIVSAQADLVTAQKNLEDLLTSGTDLAQATIDLKDAQEDYAAAASYMKYLQTNKRIPLSDNQVYIQSTRNGYEYVYKTHNYRGPATEDMLTEAANDLALKQAKLEDIQREVERLKNNKQDILAAQARVDAAQATVNSLSIIAPFDGEVLSVDHRAGDSVNTGELSVNLANLDHLYVETQVDESDIANVKLADQVQVTLDALPGVILTGKVAAINPVGQVVSGLVKFSVRVELERVKEKIFLPLGTTVNVVIKVKEASATLAVPITAIQNDSRGEYVWVVQADGSAKRADIISGVIVGELVAVTGDLKAGDSVQLLARDNGFDAPNPFGGNQK